MGEPAVYLIIGVLVIVAAWMPLFVDRKPLSMPMIALGIGALLAVWGNIGDPYRENSSLMLYLSEFAVLISVLGAGLKLDRRFSFFAWGSTWRLLVTVLLLSIGGIAAIGYALLGISAGMAVLLGAILASTDPVLAASVGAGPPGVGEEGETKFALTSEAGLNDGIAFPFVLLGLGLVGKGGLDVWHWLAIDLVWNVVGGVGLGIALGWLLVRINDLLPERLRLSATNSGLVSVGLAFLAYGIASAIHCNGFAAVFCEAASIRYFAETYEYSRRLNHAAGQFERVAMVGVLALLGVSFVRGLFDQIGVAEVVFAILVLLVIRPIAVAIGFIGSQADRRTRAAIGYLGIRGIASLFYVSFVGPKLAAADAGTLTSVVGLVVLISVVLYGATAGAVPRLLSREERVDKSSAD
ncbi:MAG TPA: cation:proton antiporter [Pseudolabrys sp.]|jgi:NhaP-type Na+/H+ or K+/H+ antiporter|nr:cation:proton antiporter [Pseudolabrys sp.]